MNRKSGRKKRVVLWVSLSLIVVLLSIVALSFSFRKPPTAILEETRKSIALAVKEEAGIYSPQLLLKAEESWNEAMAEWKINNQKSAIFRDYGKIISLAKSATESAKKAKEEAVKIKKELTEEIESGIVSLKKSVEYIAVVKDKLPNNHSIRKRSTPLSIKLDEIEQAYRRGDLLSAKKSIDEIKKSAERLRRESEEIIDEYFSSYSRWVALDNEMRIWSKNNGGVSLVVDKFARKCIVYKGGKKLREFYVELGVNWLGDKMQRGDKATPEGKYKITVKKSGRNTIYYKALLINFPNDEDRRRFNQMKADGLISRGAHIGGAIEIHGGGGKGIDWTDGCVALENRDMDSLYALCSVGTPVAIVGSLTPPEKLFDIKR